MTERDTAFIEPITAGTTRWSSTANGKVATMSSTTSSFDFEKAVAKLLKDYRGEVIEATTDIVPEVGREAAKKLRSQSATPRRRGVYAKGWAFKSEKSRLKVLGRVYGQKPTYRLAHLLERPHMMRNGHRSEPQIHIQPVEEWANDELIDRVIRRLSGGGI